MLRALKLLFSPEKEWEKMSLNPPNLFSILFFTILPLVIFTLAIEGFGLLRLGEIWGEVGRMHIPQERVLKYTAFYGGASLLVMFLGAWLLRSVGTSFNLTASFSVCFILIALGYTPILLLRIPDAIPQINTWICWAIGAALSFRILYHGVGIWLRPEQTKGFGILIVSVVCSVVLSGLIHFAATQIVKGRLLRNIYPEPASAITSRHTGITANAPFRASLPRYLDAIFRESFSAPRGSGALFPDGTSLPSGRSAIFSL